ncbi:uncharacterized protein MAM_08342 [Metarhizium album ARSEF 1941]|uniref:Uncharacterized protein n=1 Tax=Metarhizium album (strain ARSEF 1941) TaxID=1081103 RepID=A0A0B2WLC6_METAS|nr:uncharacterized protein MAM_08342 [Metarhizium album ARSEF 1941]KHN93815.1 hypothetical protein MAM_08342 [Metarhizium album ARSEF 1941]
MPNKSIYVGKSNESIMLDIGARKTERSHEENQERAYIAASRRADRSIEARVQSARQASEIHKKRTGKGFKITEEIVIREEMYEEEDDDLPRSIHLLTAHMQTPSADMNARLESYLANKVAFSHALAQSNMAWRSNDINRAFAESFPHAMPQMALPQQQHVPQPPGCPPPANMPNQVMHQHPECYSPAAYSPSGYSPTNYSPAYSPAPFSPGAQPSMPSAPPTTGPGPLPQSSLPFVSTLSYPNPRNGNRRRSRASASPNGKRRCGGHKSPPAPGRRAKLSLPATPTTATTPSLDGNLAADTPSDSFEPTAVPADASAFTTELPAEARMILDGVGADDVLCQTLASQELFHGHGDFAQQWMDPSALCDPSSLPRGPQMGVLDPGLVPNLYGAGPTDHMASKCAMPTPTDDESWSAFINENIWTTDQNQ